MQPTQLRTQAACAESSEVSRSIGYFKSNSWIEAELDSSQAPRSHRIVIRRCEVKSVLHHSDHLHCDNKADSGSRVCPV